MSEKTMSLALFVVLFTWQSGIAQVYQATDNPLANHEMYLAGADLAPFNLKLMLNDLDNGHRKWTNSDKTAKIQSVSDIRWHFTDPYFAEEFHLENHEQNAEKSKLLTGHSISGIGEELVIYYKDKEDPIMKAFGIDKKAYYFLFRVQHIVAKVFISGDKELTVEEAAKIASLAETRILNTLQ